MRRTILLLLSALILACTISGQTGGSSQSVDKKAILSGTVYDINGSVIPFSHLVARSFAGNEYQATTNNEGSYKFELSLGVYKIEANATGFCPKRIDQFRVGSSNWQQRPLNFILEISQSDRPCPQATMIKKQRPIRKPELFRSIAE